MSSFNSGFFIGGTAQSGGSGEDSVIVDGDRAFVNMVKNLRIDEVDNVYAGGDASKNNATVVLLGEKIYARRVS